MGKKKENKNKSVDKLLEAVLIARDNGLSYAELQVKETLGEVAIIDGKLVNLKKGDAK